MTFPQHGSSAMCKDSFG